MPHRPRTALLMLDFQAGIADKPFAADAVARALVAQRAAREAHILTLCSRVRFRADHTDISERNLAFGAAIQQDLFVGEASRLLDAVAADGAYLTVDKNRFSAFSGNDLEVVLRSQEVEHLVLCGVSTSGVVLSTFAEAVDRDYSITILNDACADPLPTLHALLIEQLFPRSARVCSVQEWLA
jgi:nicotinamidase-related amidase